MTLSAASGKVCGKELDGWVEIPNFSEEFCDIQEVEIEVALPGASPRLAALLDRTVRGGGWGIALRLLLTEYRDTLASEHSETVRLPRATSSQVSTQQTQPKTVQKISLKNKLKNFEAAAPKQRRKVKTRTNSDLMFYTSLLSLVGVGAVVIIKLIGR